MLASKNLQQLQPETITGSPRTFVLSANCCCRHIMCSSHGSHVGWSLCIILILVNLSQNTTHTDSRWWVKARWESQQSFVLVQTTRPSSPLHTSCCYCCEDSFGKTTEENILRCFCSRWLQGLKKWTITGKMWLQEHMWCACVTSKRRTGANCAALHSVTRWKQIVFETGEQQWRKNREYKLSQVCLSKFFFFFPDSDWEVLHKSNH